MPTNGLAHISTIVARIAAGVSLVEPDASSDDSPQRNVRAKMHGDTAKTPAKPQKTLENAV